ncbi:hypothetical protein TEA_001768 [Camellia sinensis var. sinensis]|uniref:GRAM domain-containing protein n=1 Tax=Camellia sinensis var. sinensis TaxID=542762 RepID=A0A4V3WJZ2_CAMSN|nr:hypothetical protein TEA_001768 [Camellia sinensis var. sinensis]
MNQNQNQNQGDRTKPNTQPSHSSEYAPYPKLDPNDVASPAHDWTTSGNSATTMPPESNPYLTPSSVPDSSMKNTMDSVKDHLKMGPSFADAAVGRIAQGTKVLAEGGYEKVFRQTFETVPEEKLLNSYACYLSTSAGPVMGTLYVSTAKLAFCRDNPLSYKVGDQTQWSYYKLLSTQEKHKLKEAYEKDGDSVQVWTRQNGSNYVCFNDIRALIKGLTLRGNVIDVYAEMLMYEQQIMSSGSMDEEKSYIFSTMCLPTIRDVDEDVRDRYLAKGYFEDYIRHRLKVGTVETQDLVKELLVVDYCPQQKADSMLHYEATRASPCCGQVNGREELQDDASRDGEVICEQPNKVIC